MYTTGMSRKKDRTCKEINSNKATWCRLESHNWSESWVGI